MPRKARLRSTTNLYHIVIRGLDRQIIFEELQDFKKYLKILEKVKLECNFELIGYVLMTNHIHLLIHTNDVPLETIFRKLNTSYALWFNMKYHRYGHLQQERYYSEPIESEAYLFDALRYIHQNPLKAGLEKNLGDNYFWSSYNEYKSGNSTLTDIDFIYKFVSQESFLAFNQIQTDKTFLDIDTIRMRLPDDVAKQIILTTTNCSNSTEFQDLPITMRNKYLVELNKKRISIRQLNRLTGIPKGIIERALRS